MARARGASPTEISQIEGDAERALVSQSFAQEGEALGEYQSLIGNILQGQASLALGGGALAKAGQAPAEAPRSRGVTVVCTALYKRGDISRQEYIPCVKHGLAFMHFDKAFHHAYLTLYSPVASAYMKWGWFRKLTRPFLVPWAKHISDGNKLGGMVNSVGSLPIRFLVFARRCYGRQLQNS